MASLDREHLGGRPSMRSPGRRTLWRMGLLALLLASPSANAHPLAPALLNLQERGDGRVEIAWKRPLRVFAAASRSPVLPSSCKPVETLPSTEDGLSATDHWVLDCGKSGLVGQRIGVNGLDATGTDALLRVGLRDGRVIQRVLRPTSAFVTVPSGRRRSRSRGTTPHSASSTSWVGQTTCSSCSDSCSLLGEGSVLSRPSPPSR